MKVTVLVLAIITPLICSTSANAATVQNGTTSAYGVTIKRIPHSLWKMEVTADKPGHQVRAELLCGVHGGGTAPAFGKIVRQAGKVSTASHCPGADEVPVQRDWRVNLGTAKHPNWRTEKYGSIKT